MEGRVHLVETGVVINVQHAVNLREMPPKTPCQICFAYALVSHALVEDDLDCGESRKGYLGHRRRERGRGISLRSWIRAAMASCRASRARA